MHPCMSTILSITQDNPGQDEFPAAASFHFLFCLLPLNIKCKVLTLLNFFLE